MASCFSKASLKVASLLLPTTNCFKVPNFLAFLISSANTVGILQINNKICIYRNTSFGWEEKHSRRRVNDWADCEGGGSVFWPVRTPLTLSIHEKLRCGVVEMWRRVDEERFRRKGDEKIDRSIMYSVHNTYIASV